MGASVQTPQIQTKATSETRCFSEADPIKIQRYPVQRRLPQSSNKQQKIPQRQVEQFKITKADWVWPNGIIPYDFDLSLTWSMKEKIYQAFDEYNSKTPIKFYSINQEYPAEYVKFHKSTKNTSYTQGIGRRINGGAHKVYLLETQPVGTYVHEIMHILGFKHEQCRQDRDDYVTVNEQKMLTQNEKYQYEKKDGCMLGQYDPQSIMHYRLDKNMTSSLESIYHIGQRRGLSQGDIKGINYVYGNYKCTYDAFGDEYYSQSFYECIDCWGQGSCFGVCELCAVICHGGHNLKFNKAEAGTSFVCDCGRCQHKQGLCTRQTTQKKFVKQKMYICYDCFDNDEYRNQHNGASVGICISCYKKCHKNHNVQFYELAERFFCDCGLDACKIYCKAQK